MELQQQVKNVNHSYTSASIYNVTLTAFTNQGCSGVDTEDGRVGDVPIVDFDWSAILAE